MFAPEVFRKQMYCIEEITCDIVELFGARIVIRRPGNCVPLVTPLAEHKSQLRDVNKNESYLANGLGFITFFKNGRKRK